MSDAGRAGRRMGRCAAAAFLLVAGPAAAHGPGISPVHPVLGPLPPALNGVTVEVAETLAPEVLIANHGRGTLEILDPAGRPFVRIGPKGVEADLAAAAWYETLSTARPPVPVSARDPDAPPRWTTVEHAPEWGWFDPRISVAHVMVAPAVAAADQPAPVGAWSIPVRMDSRATAIAGRFVFRPAADGAFVASLATPPGFPADIGVHVSQGALPAIFLSNAGPETVTVLGLQGEPVIRIGPGGVSVNTGSPTWRQFGREERGSDVTQGEHWLTVSKQPAYTWMEPRGTTDAEASHAEKDWKIPLRVGDAPFELQARSVWDSGHEATVRLAGTSPK